MHARNAAAIRPTSDPFTDPQTATRRKQTPLNPTHTFSLFLFCAI